MNLRLTADQLATLREHLLLDDQLERAAYLYCTRTGDRLLTTAVHPVTDDDMMHSSATACRPDPDVELEHLNACSRTDQTPVLVHSHPFADDAWFSDQDAYLKRRYQDWLQDDRDIGFGVLAQEEIIVDLLDTGEFQPMTTTIVGDWQLDTPIRGTNPDIGRRVNTQIYDRAIRAFGVEGQQTLAEAHVAVVGCGGLGSQLALEVTRLGCRKLTLIDPDDVEASNLPRLWGAKPGDVGRAKVAVVQAACWQYAPDTDITTVYTPVEEAVEQLEQVDVILAGVDQLTPRVWLNAFAVRNLLPYIDAGTRIELDDEQEEIVEMEGFVQTIAPGATSCFDCLDRANHETLRREQLSDAELEDQVERGYISETALAPAPAVVHLNGTTGSLAVSALAQAVTGYTAPPGFQRYDNLQGTVSPMQTRPAGTCPTCGDDGVLALGGDPATDTFEFGDAVRIERRETMEAIRPALDRCRDFPTAVKAFFSNHL